MTAESLKTLIEEVKKEMREGLVTESIQHEDNSQEIKELREHITRDIVNTIKQTVP